MIYSPYIHRANAMKDINNQREVKVDDTEVYKPGDKVEARGEQYSVIMIILNEYDLSVITNETGILH